MIKNTVNGYGLPAKFFHWIMALLLIIMYLIAYTMTNIPKSDFRMSLYNVHKSTGLLLLTLVALRLAWRIINVQPSLPVTMPVWQRFAAKATIFTLYLCMFFMPITGFLLSTMGGHDVTVYGLFTIPALAHNEAASDFFGESHELISYLLIAAFVLHVLGALYHHFFLKDNVFKRMWVR